MKSGGLPDFQMPHGMSDNGISTLSKNKLLPKISGKFLNKHFSRKALKFSATNFSKISEQALF